MNLLFKKLTLDNFRIYHGEHNIEFSMNEKKHLTVVHAENSTGKTTMLNSIKWCLYGETPDFTDDDILVNDRTDKKTCSVRLNFIYDNNEYSAYRRYDQSTRQDRFTLNSISKHGASSPIDEPESVIDNILPKELSDYFLFAGEHFTGALGTDNRVSHKRAIRDILGFNLPELAIKDLEFLINKNSRALSTILKKEAGTAVVAREVDLFKDELESLGKVINRTSKEITEYREIKEISQEKIANSNHLEAQQLNKSRREKEAELKVEINRESNLLTQKQGLISKYGTSLFGSKLADISLDFIKKERRSIPAPYDQSFVKELLEDRECICGRELQQGSLEYDSVKSMASSANTDLIVQRVQKATSIGDSFDQRASEFLQEVERIEKELKAATTKIAGLEDAKSKIDAKIKSIGNVDISQYQESMKNAENKIIELSESLGADRRSQGIIEGRLKAKETELKKINPHNNQHKNFENFENVAKSVLKRIESKLNKIEKNAVLLIAQNVQKNLDASLRKPFKVEVDENDYSFRLRDKETGRVIRGADGGKGQALLSNLSFVTALIAYSKKRSESVSPLFPPGTIAPFVIDAPFGQMDSTYQKNTLEFLPGQSHQLILFLSTGQWDDKFEEIIGKYIGKRYLLINHGETQNEDLETISIKGKTHSLSEPNTKASQTTIQEI